MKLHSPWLWRSSFLVFMALLGVAIYARTLENSPPQAELDKTIAGLDTKLFNSFNKCDLKQFGALLAENVEFYDDRDGLEVGREKQVEEVKDYICGKVTRELVPGTLQVYRMEGYGALEIGTHRFHHPGHEDSEPVGEAKFVHLWQYKDGSWMLSRIISYDHHAASK
jgi:hypothetical protein